MEITRINALKERGFNIFPLGAGVKSPIAGLNWTQFQSEKYDGTFPDSCNVAVICGAISNNIFVVDLDSESIYDELPDWMKNTYTIQTGKGKHLYYHYHGFAPPNKKLDDHQFRHIDIKSEGGYVLAEGSFYNPTDKDRLSKKYSKENEYGFYYKLYKDVPILDVEIPNIHNELEKIGFAINSTSLNDIKKGVSEGSRDDSTFKLACYYVREGLFGESLKHEIEKMNEKNNPPLPQSDIDRIIKRAEGYESKHTERHISEAKQIRQEYHNQNDPIKLKMQEIDPKLHENIPIIFDCMITAVGERLTYTKEADCYCPKCGEGGTFKCNDYFQFLTPKCKKDNCEYSIQSKQTAYIQQLIIEEFLEDAKNSSPISFDAEITDNNVGSAYMGQRKTLLSKFRSIPNPKTGRNIIIFEVTDMKDMIQDEGSLPTDVELQSWRDCENFFDRVTASIIPDLLMDIEIIQSTILWASGGTAINGKRSSIHTALIGDAQLGKSELGERYHKLLVGSGRTIGGKTSGAGLTIGMVKTHNGMLIPRAGYFPQYTNHNTIIDEGDKMGQPDQDSCLEVMEQETATLTKVGIPSMTLSAICPLLFMGNPKGGKFNDKFPTVMDNFNMSIPFISRFDIVWCMKDHNNPDMDKKTRKFIRSFSDRKESYMKDDELQRYFTYIKSIHATIPSELMDKIDDLHIKMRPLNKKNGLPIGWRQYHGLYRLVTASATAHLRTIATQEDFDLVENIIRSSLKSMNMNMDTGKVDKVMPEKITKEGEWLEAWAEVLDKDLNTIDKDEFILALSKKEHYRLTAEAEWTKHQRSGHMELDDIGRWNWRGFK